MISERYKQKNSFGILIAVRSDSKRLPGKHFKIINNKLKLSVLDYCIKRCKKSKIKNIILCTSNHQKDNIFEKYAKKANVNIFRGSKNNVLKRYIDCAEKNNVSNIIRITGDCPLVDTNIINSLVSIYNNNNFDYVSNVNPPSYPDGLDVEIIKLSLLKKSLLDDKSTQNQEHVTLNIRKCNNYRKYNMSLNQKDLSKIKWSVDTEIDLNLIKMIVMKFHPKIHFDWEEIYTLNTFN